MGGHAPVVVVETEHLVDELEVDKVHWPGCFVDRVFKAPKVYKKIEIMLLKE